MLKIVKFLFSYQTGQFIFFGCLIEHKKIHIDGQLPIIFIIGNFKFDRYLTTFYKI
jgi:hypothetical protein